MIFEEMSLSFELKFKNLTTVCTVIRFHLFDKISKFGSNSCSSYGKMSITLMACNFHEVGYLRIHSLHRTNLDKKFFLLNFSCTCTKYEDLQAVALNFWIQSRYRKLLNGKLYIWTAFSQLSEVFCKIGDLKNIVKFTRKDAVAGVFLLILSYS